MAFELRAETRFGTLFQCSRPTIIQCIEVYDKLCETKRWPSGRDPVIRETTEGRIVQMLHDGKWIA